MGWKDDPVVSKGQPGGSWQADPVVVPPKGKPRKDQLLGLEVGLQRPVDNAASWLEGGLRKVGVPTDKINDFFGMPSADEANAQHKAAIQQRADQGVVPGGFGKTVGNLVAAAPVVAVTKNPYLVGAGQGALTSEADDPMGLAMDAATGAVLNKVGGVVVDKVADVAKPVIDPAVKLLQSAGVRLTPGQIKGGKAMVAEDKAMSRPRVGDTIAADRRQGIEDFNRGAINRALLPLGIRLPDNVKTGHDAVAFMQDAVGTAYDKIMPNLKLAPDSRMAVGWRDATKIVATLPEREADLFSKITQNSLRFQPGQALTGRALAVALRDLKKAAAGYSSSASEAERQLGAALGSLDDGIQSALGAQNPGYAQALKATNQAYKGTRIVSDAAKGADEGIASTGQLKSAVRQNDRSKNQRQTASGRAFMQDYSEAGRKVLPSKTPDSGTVGRGQAGKWQAEAKGIMDDLAYKADRAYSQFLTAPRPKILQDIGDALRRQKGTGGLLSAATVPGLLSGLLQND
jgi:hypothetical protein